VIFADPLSTGAVLRGRFLIGLGGGLFAVATLTAAMTMPTEATAGRGLALGAWGAAQATAAGLSIALGGGIRDAVNHLASPACSARRSPPSTGYSVVYHLEIALLFGTLVALGPLVRLSSLKPRTDTPESGKFGLADFPT
jgi:MFS transporter, BCD family, chlorophyll transporter